MATKTIKIDLQINGKRISTFEELQDNFSAELLPIFQSGRLHKWFMSRGMTEQANAVKAIDTQGSELEQLTSICQVLDLECDEEALGFMVEDMHAEQEAAKAPAQKSKKAESTVEAEEENLEVETTGTGVDWSGQDMSGRSFVGEDFRNGKFVGTNFTECDLSKADFSGADLSNALFYHTNLFFAKFDNAILTGATFEAARQTCAKCAQFKKANFSKAQIDGWSFEDCNFQGAIFKESYFNKYFKISGSDFEGCDFSFSKFHEECETITFDKYNERKVFANFTKAKLTGILGVNRELFDRVTARFLDPNRAKREKMYNPDRHSSLY